MVARIKALDGVKVIITVWIFIFAPLVKRRLSNVDVALGVILVLTVGTHITSWTKTCRILNLLHITGGSLGVKWQCCQVNVALISNAINLIRSRVDEAIVVKLSDTDSLGIVFALKSTFAFLVWICLISEKDINIWLNIGVHVLFVLRSISIKVFWRCLTGLIFFLQDVIRI